jgi:hypothetical protein
MDKKIIFVFILLTTLLIVNAIPPQLRKRVTVFEPCANTPPISVTEIEPDPLIPGELGKFHFSGTLASTIPAGYKAAAFFHNLDGGTAKLINYFTADICTPDGILKCPYPAKTPFSGVLSGKVPADLPKAYGMLVVIGNPDFDVLIGCARAFVGGAQPTTPSPTSKAPAPPPASPPPPPPPSSPTPSAPAPPASSPSSSGKGSGGIQDSIIINGLFN